MVGGTIGLNFRQLEVWQRLKARNPRYARLEQKGFAEPILVKLMQRIGIGLVGERDDAQNDKGQKIEIKYFRRMDELRNVGFWIEAGCQIPIGRQ